MIENALVFALGALTAGLIALALLPVFTRRARRLARAAAEARIPKSASELVASRDAIRAEYAAKTARVETELRLVQDLLTAEQTTRTRDQQEVVASRAEVVAMRRVLRDLEGRLEELRDDLRRREEVHSQAAADLREAERRIAQSEARQAEVLERAAEAERLAEDMKAALIAAEAQISALTIAAEQIKAERDIFSRRATDAEERLALRPTVSPNGAEAFNQALQSLLTERARLVEESFQLRNERDRARLDAAERSPAAVEDWLARSRPRIAATTAVTEAEPEPESPAAAADETGEQDSQVQRVEDLANRLRALRARNASVRGRLPAHEVADDGEAALPVRSAE